MSGSPEAVARAERIGTPVSPEAFGVVQQPLTAAEKAWNNGALRKTLLLVALALAWEGYARWIDNPLLVPTFSATLQALWEGISSGVLPGRTAYSVRVLLMGYSAGISLAALLTALAVSFRLGTDLLETLSSMFNPLPAIALLPLALLWFGLGNPSLMFVMVHSVLWPVALNTHSGFRAVSTTLRMVGQNCGLTGPRYILQLLIPAAFPSILTGLKIGWAFAWRTLIAAELVFGVSAGQGGLGWFIYENKNQLEVPSVFAGLFCVILIGLAVENLIFRNIEMRTVRRWGMQV
ncbi:MAG: ABC transporter permease [Candidatus Methylomirabilales bacterium]